MPLNRPTHITPYTSTSSTEAGREPLKIRYVGSDNKDLSALGVNVAIAIILFAVVSLFFRFKTDHVLFTWTIPAIVVWIGFVLNKHRLWVEVGEQEAYVYVDMLFSSKLIVYLQGGHFTSILSRKQPETVSFKKSQVGGEEPIEFKFPTNDGLEIIARVRIFSKQRNSEVALSHSLRWPLQELHMKIRAMVGRRLSDYGAVNTFDTIRENKPELSYEIANMFGGEGSISPFEEDTGLNIDDPVIIDLSLTPESQEVFLARARVEVLRQGIRDMRDAPEGCTGKDILDAVQAAAGVANHTIQTIRGVENATVVGVGDAGIGLVTDRKKGGKK